jgi:hypothetical protein
MKKNYVKFEDDEGLGLPNLSVKKPSLTRVILYPINHFSERIRKTLKEYKV